MVFLGFLYVYAMSKSVFVFYVLKMAECKRCLKMVGKVFLMIKNGPGFMVSHMHSLLDRKSTRLNSSHITRSRMPSSA